MPSLMAVLGLNAKPFKDTLHDSTLAAKHFGKETASAIGEMALGAFAGFKVASLTEGMLEAVTRIKELSEQFRVSTDTIQLWDKAAHRVGMSAEDIGTAFNKLKKAREEAIGGGPTAGKFLEAFGQFGIGMEELKNQSVSVEEIMQRIREASAMHPITTEEDVAGMELMGRSGAKVLSAMEQLHNLGPVHLIAGEDIEHIHEAELRLKSLKNEITIGFATMAGKAVPVADRFAMGLQGIKEFFSGRMSLNQARRIGLDETGNVEAPKFDLKGRPLTERERKEIPEPEKPNVYNKVVQVQLENAKEMKEVEKIREEIAERILQNQVKQMTLSERQAFFKKQIADHERKMIEARFGEGDELTAVREELEIAKLKGEMEPRLKGLKPEHDTDPYAKIGGHLLMGAPENSAAAKTEQNTARSAEYLKYIAEQTRATGLGSGKYRIWKKLPTDDDYPTVAPKY